MRDHVKVREVGLREGLQADPTVVPTDVKVKIGRTLLDAGVPALNAAALVHPKVMPQMADAEALLEGLGETAATISVLAPNSRGVDRALKLREKGLADELLLINAMTDGVLKANGLDRTVEEHLVEVAEMAALGSEAGMRVTVFISSAFGCSIEGHVPQASVVAMVERLMSIGGIDEIVISDSTGQADPLQVRLLLADLAPRVEGFPLTLHFHDSRGAGSANVLAAVESPIENLTLDMSFGGLGGDVPFIPEAAGNVATEDICEMLHGMGIETGVSVEGIIEASRILKEATGRAIQSRVFETGVVGWKRTAVSW